MNGPTSVYARPLDELGLEAPYSEGLDSPPTDGPFALREFDEAPFGESLEAAGPLASVAGRLVVDRHPLLRSHRGTPPDLILRWNNIAAPGEIDVVVHFHGYSGHRGAMRIDRHKERDSGLDFSDPASPGTPGRTRPTLGVLPRGNYFGGRSGSGYNFPALVRPGVLDQLVQDAVERLSRETGHALKRGRLILTGHSGGGAPVTAILAHTDPDEVHIFDGMYSSGANIVRWAERRIAHELATPGTPPPAMRILYRPGSKAYPGTQPHSEAVAQNLCRSLTPAAAARLRPYFRVDRTTVAHNDIPRRFGWMLLADAAAVLPGVTTKACAGMSSGEQLDREFEDQEASEFWHDAPSDHEESLQEAISLAEHEQSFENGEALAWLDVEAPGLEAGGFETEEPYHEQQESESIYAREAEEPEALESYDEGESPYVRHGEAHDTDMFALESLLESEAGAGTSLADRVKGVAAFVLGPTLRLGSSGPAVAALQRALASLGHDTPVDGTFASSTERAVKAFQAGDGLDPDGIVGPRTKAAIAAALGGGAAPSPVPVPPAPTPSASNLADAIVRVAEQEYRRWHGAGGKLRETDSAAVPILQQYYREGVKQNINAAQLQSKSWQAAHPWSAVFISFVMRTAGAGRAFAYSTAHQGYIRAARKNRLQNVTSNPFWAYRATEVAPQVGDLVCGSRNNSGATYDNIGDPQSRATHCDVVTEVRPGSLRVIGGNVNQNVDAKTIRTLPDGRLALDGSQARFFAVLRCRGPVGAPGPQPVPIPPTPAPPAPSGKRLTPAQFVATFSAPARASQAKNGVPALVTLGQAALESGWGEHAPRFNFFGIKAKASDPEPTRQLLRTREVCRDRNCKFPEIISITPRTDGKFDYVVRDWFRAYSDAATAFIAHGEFLVRNKRYAKAFAVAHDPYAFAAEVARAGYATDPSYERVLSSVMRKIEAAGGQ